MIATAIISVALVAALGSQSQSVSLAGEAKFSTTAAFLIQGKMAELETQDPEELGSGEGDFGDDFPQYGWRAEVSDATTEGLEDISEHLKQIDLTVRWADDERYEYRLRFYQFAPNMEEAGKKKSSSGGLSGLGQKKSGSTGPPGITKFGFQ